MRSPSSSFLLIPCQDPNLWECTWLLLSIVPHVVPVGKQEDAGSSRTAGLPWWPQIPGDGYK